MVMAGSTDQRFTALDPCVHCGFCLPACPTYLATGDEADSPRGRIVLMRALERGEIGADDPALTQHLDACLGCRGCEPACPSGVGYGQGLEAAREILARQRGIAPAARAILAVFSFRPLWRSILTAARWFRATGLPARWASGSRAGFGMGMLAATRRHEKRRSFPSFHVSHSAPTVALFRGCVMDTVFRHVNDATRRVLEANGYRVVDISGQGCCGALHEHAGDRSAAESLARQNLKAFGHRANYVVVNSAGCGALLKQYGHLVGGREAEAFAGRVRDVTELLAAKGPRQGGSLPLDVAYDAPCHLQHAQKVQAEPLAVLRAIPDLRLQVLPGSDKCCGSAGIYSMLHPEMARAVLDDKIRGIAAAATAPRIIATGNPGCHMQIGAGLRAAGLDTAVLHPVELLDESYRVGGLYSRQP
jgi:glycolate oxidase iron-sulfur subunit